LDGYKLLNQRVTSNIDTLVCDITAWAFSTGCVSHLHTQQFPITCKVASFYVKYAKSGKESCGSAEIV